MRVDLRPGDGLTAAERGRFAVLHWRMLWREWCGPIDSRRLPGRRVRARFAYVEIERVFNGPGTRVGPPLGTGARLRLAGWHGPRMSAMRFVIPWRDGALFIRALA